MAQKMTWRQFRPLAGDTVLYLLAGSVVIGVFIGFFEMTIGMAIYAFLGQVGLVVPSTNEVLQTVTQFIHPAILLIGVGVIVAGLRFAATLLPFLIGEIFQFRLRRAISYQLLYAQRETTGLTTAEITNILSNLSPKGSAYGLILAQLLSGGLIFTTLLAGLLALSWQLTLFSALATSLFMLPGILASRRFSYFSQRYYEEITAFTKRIVKDAKNTLFLKLVGINRWEFVELSRILSRTLTNAFHYHGRHAFSATYPMFTAVCLVVSVIWFHRTVFESPTTVLIPFLYMLHRTANAFGQVLAARNIMRQNLPFLRELSTFSSRLFGPEDNVTDDLGDKAGSVDFVPHSLRVCGLTVGRDSPILFNLEFEASAGEVLVIAGKSGKGKTTLLMTLTGLVRKMGGEIHWNGIPIENIPLDQLRKWIGYAGPDPFLIDGSISENLLLGSGHRQYSSEEIDRSLFCACAEFVTTLPEGLNQRLGEDGEGISAGQKQRLSIARSLLRTPSVLFLDEATANIDEETEKTILGRIRSEFPHLLIVAISHRKSMHQYSNVFLKL